MTNNNDNLKQDVLKAIEAGEVKIKPKWQFLVKGLVFTFLTVACALAALYLISFVIFELRETELILTPGLGLKGYGLLFSSLPWVLVILAVTLTIVCEILIRQYSFSYKRPYVYSALAVFLFVAIAGLGISQTSFHDMLYKRAKEDRLPFGAPFYKKFVVSPDNVTFGNIKYLTEDGFTIVNRDNEEIIVKVKPDSLNPDLFFQAGDNVLIVGDKKDGYIEAESLIKPPPRPTQINIQVIPVPQLGH